VPGVATVMNIPTRGARPDTRRVVPALLAIALLGLALPGAGSAQVAAEPAGLADLTVALEEAKRDHLWRVAIWGGANVALGVGLLASGSRESTPRRFGFGVQSTAWGAINLGIVGASLLAGDPELPTTLAGALSAENGWSDLLLVNLGLNVGYMGVGTALAVAAGRGLGRPEEVRGHAYGVIVQGAGLFILDGVAWLASRARMDGLTELVSAVEVAVVPMTWADPGTGALVQGAGIAIGLPIG